MGGSGAGATTPALSTNNSASARGGVLSIGTASVIASVIGLSLLGARRGDDAHREQQHFIGRPAEPLVQVRHRQSAAHRLRTRWFGATGVGRSSFTGSIFSIWLSRSFTTASADGQIHAPTAG